MRIAATQYRVPVLSALTLAVACALSVSAHAAEITHSSVAIDGLKSPNALRSNPDATPARAPQPEVVRGGDVFFEDFNSVCAEGAPAAPYSPPAGWRVDNVDGRTPAANVSWVSSAWVVRERFTTSVANDCAIWSTSWYTPAGAANDWAVIPLQVTPQASTRLRWSDLAPDASYPDGYEVRYSTAGTAPTDFLLNPPLLTVPAAPSVWTNREISLAALAGTPVHLAFRNNSTDKFLLALDNFRIFDAVDFDPVLSGLATDASAGGYAKVPAGLGFGAVIQATLGNAGALPLTNVQLQAEVTIGGAPSGFGVLASTPVNLAPTASQTVQVLDRLPYDQLGEWAVAASVTSAEGDQNPANSSATYSMVTVTANELSRAQGSTVGALGIGAGNGGFLGQDFQLPQTARLTAVRYRLNNQDVLPDDGMGNTGDGVGDFNGYELQVAVFAWNQDAGVPGEQIATASTTVAVDAPIASTELEFTLDSSLLLPPGRYLIAAVEPTLPEPRTLSVENTSERFTPGTVWINWPTSPAGGWANVETFGANFARTFQMTAVLEFEPFIFAHGFED
jgi:hypothetical protein